jgi:hypothetical protein
MVSFSPSRLFTANLARPFGMALALALTLTGCVRSCGNQREGMAPEKVVESYLNTALNMKNIGGREELLQYTTGHLKEAIATAPEETILKAYVNRHYELESYAVIERRDRTPRETEITFRLKYKDLGVSETRPTDTKAAPTVQTENSVALIKEKGAWFIRDVVGAKTSIDFPVTQDSEIRAKPGVITEPEPEAAPKP